MATSGKNIFFQGALAAEARRRGRRLLAYLAQANLKLHLL